MKCMQTFLIVLIAGVFSFTGCSKQKLSDNLPQQIGTYSKTGLMDLGISCSEMKSNVMATYDGDQGFALVNLVTYKKEETAKMYYDKAPEDGRKACTISGLEGMCKTDSSNNIVKVSFGWLDKDTMKIIFINERNAENGNVNEIEERCKEKLPLFIDAVKEI